MLFKQVTNLLKTMKEVTSKKENKKLGIINENMKLMNKKRKKENDNENEKLENKEKIEYEYIPIGVNEISDLNEDIRSTKKKKNKTKDTFQLTLCKQIQDLQYYQILKEIKDDDESSSSMYEDFGYLLFSSIDDRLYFVYATKLNSIIFFDVGLNQKVNETKKAHKKVINKIKHFSDKEKNRDLILSMSSQDMNIKVWNMIMECIYNIKATYKNENLSDSCFLNFNNHIFILTSNSGTDKSSEPVKIYDLEETKEKELENSRDFTKKLEVYYDENNTYIITANQGYMKSYTFNENRIYRFYRINKRKEFFLFYEDISINANKELTILMGINLTEIHFFNFHNGDFLKIIEIKNSLDFEYFNYKKRKVILNLTDTIISNLENDLDFDFDNYNKYYSLFEQRVDSPKYGECFLSSDINKIILWIKQD